MRKCLSLYRMMVGRQGRQTGGARIGINEFSVTIACGRESLLIGKIGPTCQEGVFTLQPHAIK